jgi:hypothetical protein
VLGKKEIFFCKNAEAAKKNGSNWQYSKYGKILRIFLKGKFWTPTKLWNVVDFGYWILATEFGIWILTCYQKKMKIKIIFFRIIFNF